MNPSKSEVEEKINSRNSFNIAMSVLASGAVKPGEAAEYIGSLSGIDSVLFGASSPGHIRETKEMFEAIL